MGGAARGQSETREGVLVIRSLRWREVAGDADEDATVKEVILGAKHGHTFEHGLNVGRAALRVGGGGVDLNRATPAPSNEERLRRGGLACRQPRM